MLKVVAIASQSANKIFSVNPLQGSNFAMKISSKGIFQGVWKFSCLAFEMLIMYISGTIKYEKSYKIF